MPVPGTDGIQHGAELCPSGCSSHGKKLRRDISQDAGIPMAPPAPLSNSLITPEIAPPLARPEEKTSFAIIYTRVGASRASGTCTKDHPRAKGDQNQHGLLGSGGT